MRDLPPCDGEPAAHAPHEGPWPSGDRRDYRFDVGILCAGLGIGPLAWGMSNLRSAHLARQRTGEGLSFTGVGVALIVGGSLLLLSCPLWWRAGSTTPGRTGTVGRLASLAALGLAVACAVVSFSVASHGARCIGPCG